MSYKYQFKLILVGDSSVGKSSLLLRFTDRRFEPGNELTIGVEFGARNIEVDGTAIKLQIWDTAGQETFRSMIRSYFREAAAAMLVCDVTNRRSFDHLTQWLSDISTNAGSILVMLIGNKTDKDVRTVTTQELEEFAKKHGLFFIETSAKNDYNVEEAFVALSREIIGAIDRGEIDIGSEYSGVKLGIMPMRPRPEHRCSC
mmetsp:Transcript_22667/g.40806  ORF Transcript_22667/g.40806 Transcript_22667/m.40806 type:complete len:201 (+) Transcript_22667:54-656(+)